MKYFAFLFFAVLFSDLHFAWADTLTATGGLSLGRNSGLNDIKSPSPLLGVDYTLDGSSHIDFGGFLEHNWTSYNNGTNGAMNFMGVLLRYHFVSNYSGLFVEGRLGLSQISQDSNTQSRIGYGGGVGYKIPISARFSVSPVAGARMIQDPNTGSSADRPIMDCSIDFSFKF